MFAVAGLVASVLVPVVGSGGCTVSSTQQAPSAASQSAAFPDFDGDGAADLVYGVGSNLPRDEVVVTYGSGRSQRFGRSDVYAATSPDGAREFGRGLLARDLDRDGLTDLVVVDSAIQVLFGSTSGLRPGDAHRYPVPAGVGLVSGTPALIESPTPVLVVGATVPRSVARGGAILAYRLGTDGLPAAEPIVLSQRNLPGADETGDRFGTSLAASGSLALVGAPGEDVGRVRDAGAVTVLRYRGGTRFTGTVLTQLSRGVAGKAERGDWFGWAVAMADGYAAIGVPFEDGPRRDTGAVAVFRVGATSLRPVATLTQSTRGVPGIAEAGDSFGWDVAVMRPCPGVPGILVGAPSEAIGDVGQAGSAWVLPLAGPCPKRQLAEGGRLGGAPTDMALVGMAVTALRTSASAGDTVVLTAPGVNEEGVLGRVLRVPAPYSGNVITVAENVRLTGDEGRITL